jgi:hypothetical protein
MSKKVWLGLIPIAGLLLYQFLHFDVLQDDAFISFRYIRNFLEGHGLVFNLGERVEGYTNFFWIMLLAFLAKLGLPLIETARWAGVLAACGTLAVALYAARRFYPERGWLWLLAVPFLLAANGSLAYWAGSGLETGLFALLAAAAAVTYFSRPAFSLLFLALATLTRPEGGLLAFLFGIVGILLKQKSGKQTLIFWGILALLLLPFAVFKYSYYGSLLPNPFYAKTGFSTEYLKSGLEYVGLFLKHYGGYGLFLLLPLVCWKKLSTFSQFSLLIFAGYTLYLILIGGDVLKAHRFFVSVLFFLYLPATEGLYGLFDKISRREFVFAAAVILTGLYAYQFPQSYLVQSAKHEKGLVEKMTVLGKLFIWHNYAESFAASTIGAFSYTVGAHRVIDMLGLTEPEIARNPETLAGIESSWKEKHFNARWVLSQKPEVILFSTDMKPSSPAERALFLYPEFRQCYRLEFLFGEELLLMFYRKFKDFDRVSEPDQPAEFANRLNEGLNLTRTDRRKALVVLRETLEAGPKDCSMLYLSVGYLHTLLGLPDSSEPYLQKGLELDGGGSLGEWYYISSLNAQKRYDEVLRRLSTMVAKVPTAEEFLVARGVLRPRGTTRRPQGNSPALAR